MSEKGFIILTDAEIFTRTKSGIFQIVDELDLPGARLSTGSPLDMSLVRLAVNGGKLKSLAVMSS